jgi:2-methylisocitrate lyase-like PEP mutase family enzyme
VIADCETGFGNVVNVTRAVHDFIDAGVAGFFLEDQVFPKRCGYTTGVEVIPIPDALAKYRAACDVRDAGDPDEVLRRCEAYLSTRVDMLMIMALQSRIDCGSPRAAATQTLERRRARRRRAGA